MRAAQLTVGEAVKQTGANASVIYVPAAIAADAMRLPAKRKIFWGVVLIPTIIGLFFAFDMIRAGRATLKQHPAPKRPSEARLTASLKGQWWRFW